MMVRKAPVDLAVELGHLAAQAPVEPRREHAGDAVAAVDRDMERPRQLYVGGDALDIGVQHIRSAAFSRTGLELLFFNPAAQLLYVLAPERVARHHHLEAVVFGRIVAAAHRDAAATAQVMRGEVGDRRRRHADLDDAGARRREPVGQGSDELGPRQPAVAANREGRRAALAPERAERAADVAHDRGRKAAADHAADVVGTKDFGRQAQAAKNSRTRWGSQVRRPGNGPTGNPAWPPVRGNSSSTQGAALRAAASMAGSGRKGSLRALITRVGTRTRLSQGPLEAADQ